MSYAHLFPKEKRKAIVLPYIIDQHEPSTPLNELIDIDTDNLEAECRQLFLEVFEGVGISKEELDRCEVNTDTPFGDVAFGNMDCYIFLTFLEEANDEDGEEDFEDWGSIGPPS